MTRRFKIVLTISLGLNLIGFAFVVKKLYQNYYNSKSEVEQHEKNEEITYWLNRNELYEKLPIDSNSIVFLGNSLTQNFEFFEFIHNSNIKNRGINGDITAGVLNRLDPITRNPPKKIFIEIGINDLGKGTSKEIVIRNYKKLLTKLQRECRSTKLYVQSLFPVENSSKDFPTYCNEKVNEDIKAVNKELIKYAAQNNITFIDTYSMFELEGQLNPRYSVDGLHLTFEGYLLWTKILKPFVNE